MRQSVRKVGEVGAVVSVSDGYAKNFLVPKGKAVFATKENLAQKEHDIEDFKNSDSKRKTIAEAAVPVLDAETIVIQMQASDDGKLYGSIAVKDIHTHAIKLLEKNKINLTIERGNIKLEEPIKSLGEFTVPVELYPNIEVALKLSIQRGEKE